MDVNHPVVSKLNGRRGEGMPAGFTRFQLTLGTGIPAPLPVEVSGVPGQFMLALATGRSRGWLNLDQGAVISTGREQRVSRAVDEAAGVFAAARARAVPYLMLVIERQLADAWPLTVGSRQILERGTADHRRAVAEFLLSDFQINASALGGGTPAGCWIDLGVRALAGTGEFRAPMLGRSRLQQNTLDRNPQALQLAYEFHSQVDSGVLADGTPVGGINWWLSHDCA